MWFFYYKIVLNVVVVPNVIKKIVGSAEKIFFSLTVRMVAYN